MAILLFIGGIAVLFYHLFLRVEFPYAHLFYIPIILSTLWWGKKGVSIAVGISVFLVMSSAAFLNRLPAELGIQVVMFFASAVIIALLAEGIEEIEQELKCY